MNPRIFFIVIVFLFLKNEKSFAQSTNQYIISPITLVKNGNTDINLVAAEPLNSSVPVMEAVLTQGFLQPENFIYLTVEEQKDAFFRFYPNPITEGITIEFKRECGQQMQLIILNYLGQEVQSKNIQVAFQNKLYLSLNQLETGVYLLKMHDIERNWFSSLKLIKQ